MPLPASELDSFLESENLSEPYRRQAEAVFLPFIQSLVPRIRKRQLRVLGIHGAQGSGKSTLAALIGWVLEQDGLRVAQLSLDDFYLRRAERRVLAETIHPLFQTRGVPGTHDVALGRATLRQLRGLQEGDALALPRFDKLADDRYPEPAWPQLAGPIDLIVFEGWCVGAIPQGESELREAVNSLERDEDPDGVWRRHVNGALAGAYQHWFAELDYLLMLQAPGFECVAAWRLEQEQRLAAREPGKPVMGVEQIARFVQHYERLTRHCLATLPAIADCVMPMAADRQITDVYYRQGGG